MRIIGFIDVILIGLLLLNIRGDDCLRGLQSLPTVVRVHLATFLLLWLAFGFLRVVLVPGGTQ